MAKFEGQERRMPKIEAALKEYGMTSLEEARDLVSLQRDRRGVHRQRRTANRF